MSRSPRSSGSCSVARRGEIVRVGQRAGDLVGERAAWGLAGGLARGGGGGDELPVQADPVCGPVVGCVAQQLADRVEHQRAGGRGDDAGRPIGAFHRQRRQAVAFAVTLVGDEPAQVLAVEQSRVVPALGRIVLQEGAQFRCGPAGCVEDAAGAGRLRRLQQPGQVVPDQVPQPALRDAGEVEMAAPVRKPDPEVVGLDESGVAGIGRGVVDQPQLALDLLGDRAGHLRTAADVGLQADQRVELQVAAGGHQRPEPPELPALRPGAAGVDEQSPLDLRGHQRPQPEQVDPAAARWRRAWWRTSGGTPARRRSRPAPARRCRS